MKKIVILLCLTFLSLHLIAGIGMSKQELIKMYSINVDSIIERSEYDITSISIGDMTLEYDIELDLVVKQTIYNDDHTKIGELNKILYDNYMYYSNGWFYYQKHSVNYEIFMRIYYVEYFDFYVIEFILEDV